MATSAPPKTDAARHADGDWKPELHEVPIESIDVGANVRTEVGDVSELAASIEAHGVIAPIAVAEAGAGRYDLIYGQRRLVAAQEVGLTTIPAVVGVGALDESHRLQAQLIENLQRADLNPIDTATAYRALLDAGLTQRELGTQLGIAQPTISHALRLLKAPAAVRSQIASGELSASAAKAIASLPDAEQTEIARRVTEHGLSAHAVEEEVRLAGERVKAADRDRDLATAAAARLPDLLKEHEVDPAGVTLIADGSEAWAPALVAAGFAVAKQPKVSETLYNDWTDACQMVSVRWHSSWGDRFPPQLSLVCVDAEHRGAREAERTKRQAADAKKRAADNDKYEAELKARQQAERDAQIKAAASVIDRLTADPELRGRALLWSLADTFEYSSTGDAFGAEVDYAGWETIAALPIADVERWALAFLAEDVLDAPDVLAAVVPPKPAAKPKAAKAKG